MSDGAHGEGTPAGETTWCDDGADASLVAIAGDEPERDSPRGAEPEEAAGPGDGDGPHLVASCVAELGEADGPRRGKLEEATGSGNVAARAVGPGGAGSTDRGAWGMHA